VNEDSIRRTLACTITYNINHGSPTSKIGGLHLTGMFNVIVSKLYPIQCVLTGAGKPLCKLDPLTIYLFFIQVIATKLTLWLLQLPHVCIINTTEALMEDRKLVNYMYLIQVRHTCDIYTYREQLCKKSFKHITLLHWRIDANNFLCRFDMFCSLVPQQLPIWWIRTEVKVTNNSFYLTWLWTL